MLKKGLLKSIAITIAFNIFVMNFSFVAYAKNNNSNNSNLGEAEEFVIDRGIMKGDGNGNYYMSNYIKRGDLMVMLVRAFNLNSFSSENFLDVPKKSYYYSAIATARGLGFAKGDGKQFFPNKNVTLEEAILFIERAAILADGEIEISSNLNLRKIFNNSMMSKFATRQDVANLLYYTMKMNGNIVNEEDPKIIYYSARKNKKVRFDDEDFIQAFKNIGGEELDWVRFKLPPENTGKLYHDYSRENETLVDSSTDYYVDSTPGISRVTFVPELNYSGTVTIGYFAFNNDGDYNRGIIKITIEDDDKDKIDDIEYVTNPGKRVDLKKEDFIDAYSEISDIKLKNIKFTLPSVTYGKLYYIYRTVGDFDALVKETEEYYIDKSPSVSDVSFVTRSDCLGTVPVIYTAYDEKGGSVRGFIKITVEKNEYIGAKINTINYSTFKNREIEFNDKDFVEAFYDTVDDALFSVTFNLPPSSCGTLYYDYTTGSKNNSLVKPSTKYYVDSKPDLDEITFVPKSGYTGITPITYTAYSEDGDFFEGKIEVKVYDIIPTINFTTNKNQAITLNRADFIEAYKKTTNENLSSVSFILPPTSIGRMYYNKISRNSYESIVKPSDKFMVDDTDPYLSKVDFLPSSDYKGNALITYIAYNEDEEFTIGTIQITVK